MTRSRIILRIQVLVTAAVLIPGALSRPAVAQTPAALRPTPGVSVGLTVEPVSPPVPVGAQERLHLVYELRLASFDWREVRVDRLDVLADSSAESTLASYNASELAPILFRAGDTLGLPEPHRIAVGTHVIAYLWLALDSAAAAPSSLVHRFTLITVGGTKVDTTTLETPALAVAREAPVVIGPPLRGGLWYARNAPSNDSRHRRVLRPLNGELRLGSRFAFDWVKYRNDGSGMPDPATYGAEVVAVADARVAEVIDGIPDNWTPDQARESRAARAVPMTLATVRGNAVTLDLGGDKYALYVHLQPGSIRVKPGDRVRRGQVLGLVGNSGNSTGPHLHFHVASSAGLNGHGLPFVLDSFELVAMVPQRPDWREHIVWIPAAEQARRHEMPLSGSAVRFP
jgi:murein DD-endopeptidase MepM/ murein hydrolase activator NlpD